MPTSKLVIGLIGGIGSGKSSVGTEFVRHGAAVIGGDSLGHDALHQPEIRAKVIERCGTGIANSNGEIDRRKLGAIVFADINLLRALEAIVFPWIKRALEEQVAAAQRDPKVRFIVVDAAVMVEAGWNKMCDKIVYVDASTEQRLARLALQRGWTAEEMAARSNAQLPLAGKKLLADAIIDNSGSADERARRVDELVKQWVFPVAFQS